MKEYTELLLTDNIDNLHEMFGIDVQYQVPQYQRRYVWNESNWETLWDDFLVQSDYGLEDKNRGHFTGNIVIRPITEGQLNRFEVIDGQQRLTTFQIILCVLRDMCLIKGYQELADEANRHIINTEDVVRRNNLEGFPYKFCPTDYDKLAFITVVGGEYSNNQPYNFTQGDEVSRGILGVYNYFKKMIIEYVGSNCSKDKIGDIITSFKFDFQLIQITIASSSQSEKIFESLNATGRLLSEFDYLRNNLFLRTREKKDGNGRFYSDVFYEKYWHFESDSLYWENEKLESFFQAFLMAKLGPIRVDVKDIKPFALYREYRKKLENNLKIDDEIQILEYEFQQLQAYSETYKQLIQEMNEPSSELSVHMQFYDILNIPNMLPLILFVKHGFSSDLDNVCEILESYIIRRLFCFGEKKDSFVKINKESYKKIQELFSLAAERSDFSSKVLAEYLAENWPEDIHITKAFKHTKFKDSDLISYIFRRMKIWKEEEAASYGEYIPLGLADQMTHLSIIHEKLEEIHSDGSKLLDIKDTFNEIWPPFHFFI